MSINKIILLLCLITILGLLLRLNHYDQTPPWRESDDEIHYAWAGLSWMTEGVPKSWSYLSSYPKTESFKAWGADWRIVSPMLEKPPLYSLLSGLTVLANGEKKFEEVRLSTIRLLPIGLSAITIFLTGMIASTLFSPMTGILAALLYAINPFIVLSNRLSVTENLITPLSLLTLWFFIKDQGSPKYFYTYVAALCAGLTVLTKQSGIAVIFAFAGLYIYFKHRKKLTSFLIISGGCALIFPLVGFLYDWDLFLKLATEGRRIGIQGGLPQLIFSILSRPLIGTQRLFPDGTMLLGYLLLFVSPFLYSGTSSLRGTTRRSNLVGNNDLIRDRHAHTSLAMTVETERLLIFLAFPLAYITYLALFISAAEPIGSGQGFWGWYVYPLFPYVMILVAQILIQVWKQITIYPLLITILILGSSSVRYLFLFLPQALHYRWQQVLFVLITLSIVSFLPVIRRYQRLIMLSLFCLYLGINLFVNLNLSTSYPSLPQP